VFFVGHILLFLAHNTPKKQTKKKKKIKNKNFFGTKRRYTQRKNRGETHVACKNSSVKQFSILATPIPHSCEVVLHPGTPGLQALKKLQSGFDLAIATRSVA